MKKKVQEPTKVFNKIKDFFCNNKLAFLTTMILGLVTHFYLYTHNVLSPDAVADGTFHISGEWEISLGRWLLPIVDSIRGGIVSEILIIFISLILLSISSVFLIKLFKIKNKILMFLVSAIIATAPQFAESFMYIYCGDGYCLAMLASILAVYFMRKENKVSNNILSIIMIIVTCACYQSYLGVTVGLSIILLILDILNKEDNKETLKKGIRYAIIEIIGIILYYLITKIVLKVQGLTLATYSGADSIGMLNTIKNLPRKIIETYKSIIIYFFTDKMIYNHYWKRDILNVILFLVSMISFIIIIIKNKIYKDKIKLVLLMFLIFITPIGLSIMTLIATERSVNIIMAASFLLVNIVFLKLYEYLDDNNVENTLKYFIVCITAILCFTFMFSNNASYICREETFRNYYTNSLSILTRAQSLEGYHSDMKFMFNNIIKHEASLIKCSNGFLSNSNETWESYDGILSNVNFYKRYFGMDLTMCSREEYKDIIETEEFKNMSVFPDDNSIKIINNIVVVKLSEESIWE